MPYDMEVPHSEGILSSQLDDPEFFNIERLGENAHEQLLDRGQVQTTKKRGINEIYENEPQNVTQRQPATKKRGEREFLFWRLLRFFYISFLNLIKQKAVSKPKANRFDTSLSKLTEKFVRLIHHNHVSLFFSLFFFLFYSNNYDFIT